MNEVDQAGVIKKPGVAQPIPYRPGSHYEKRRGPGPGRPSSGYDARQARAMVSVAMRHPNARQSAHLLQGPSFPKLAYHLSVHAFSGLNEDVKGVRAGGSRTQAAAK